MDIIFIKNYAKLGKENLKKILLFLLLLPSLYADAQIYIGAGAAAFSEDFNNGVEAKGSAKSAKFKIGYGDRAAYGVEFSLDYVQTESKIFSSSNAVSSDGNRYGINVELVKAFDFDIYVLPFFKAGFGTGFLDINRETQKSLRYGSYNLSFGTLLPINKNLDFELSYDYKYTSYEAIDTISEKIRYESNVNTAYFGFNIRY